MNIHPDIAAMIDVIAELNETTDSMTVEEAVHVRESVVELRRAANVLLGLCDTQLLAVLESPREFDGMRYSVGNDGKWRPNQMKIDSAVKRHSLVDENGEVRPAGEAVERAIAMMRSCYVANSTFPKTGALDALGLDKPDVGHYEKTGSKVKVEPVEPA